MQKCDVYDGKTTKRMDFSTVPSQSQATFMRERERERERDNTFINKNNGG